MASFERIPLDDFNKMFSSFTELSSNALGGQVISVSDDFFASVHHLLHVEVRLLQGTLENTKLVSDFSLCSLQ
jgi:allantoicase